MDNVLYLMGSRGERWEKLPIVNLLTVVPDSIRMVLLNTIDGAPLELGLLACDFAPLLTRLLAENSDVELRAAFTFVGSGGLVAALAFKGWHFTFDKPEAFPELGNVGMALAEFEDIANSIAIPKEVSTAASKVMRAFEPYTWTATTNAVPASEEAGAGVCVFMSFKSGLVIRINIIVGDSH